jgi:hypothetical protein
VLASGASAGTYTVGYDFVYNAGFTSGWHFQTLGNNANHLCGPGHDSCDGYTVLGNGTRGFGAWSLAASHPAGHVSRVGFIPPPGTTLLQMNTDMLHVTENNSYMRVRVGGRMNEGEAWGLAERVKANYTTSTITRAGYSYAGGIGGGFSVELVNGGATNTTNVRNGFSLKAATATLSDGSLPTVDDPGGLPDGWVAGQACVNVSTSDAGSGVSSVQLIVAGVVRASAGKSSGHPYRPGVTESTPSTLCFDTSALPDGRHPAVLRVVDATGNVTDAGYADTLGVANGAPGVTAVTVPTGTVTDPTPSFLFRLVTGPSGLSDSGSRLTIDGAVVAQDFSLAADGSVTIVPEAPLSAASHTWHMRFVNGVGKVAEARGTFTVARASSTMTIATVLAPAATGTDRTPRFRFRVNPGQETLEDLQLYVDGASVGEVVGDSVGYVVDPEQPLALGEHTWEVVATAQGGGVARLEGRFLVYDPARPPASVTRLVVAGKVRARRGKVRVVARVVRGARGVRGRTVTCRRGRTTRRARTDRKGAATCVLPFSGGTRKVVVTVAGIPGRRVVSIVT